MDQKKSCGHNDHGREKENLDMARFKAERAMKVHSISGKGYWDRKPSIQLSGEWVRDLGFEIGEPIAVRCEKGKLTVLLKVQEEVSESGEGSSDLQGGLYGIRDYEEVSVDDRECNAVSFEVGRMSGGADTSDSGFNMRHALPAGAENGVLDANENTLMVAETRFERSGI